jgi:hypothetical protein
VRPSLARAAGIFTAGAVVVFGLAFGFAAGGAGCGVVVVSAGRAAVTVPLGRDLDVVVALGVVVLRGCTGVVADDVVADDVLGLGLGSDEPQPTASSAAETAAGVAIAIRARADAARLACAPVARTPATREVLRSLTIRPQA